MKYLILIAIITLFFGCKTEQKEENKSLDQSVEINQSSQDYIEIVTNVMDFVTKDTVPSGWNTFKYINKSTEPHFVLFDDYPEDKGEENARNEVAPVFDKGMKLINEGKMDQAIEAFGELPDWFRDVVFTGGSGLISAGQENTFTLKLKPGNYIMECYVKMANGVFHSSMGMTKEIWVTEEKSNQEPPETSVNVALSSVNGIVIKDVIEKGEQTFMVEYEDQIVHENFVGHDINLVKLDNDADLNALEEWMNWATPTGLMTPTPEGVTFLGGTNDAPAESVQYFTANLTPGNYALISEVPNAKEKGMFITFTIN